MDNLGHYCTTKGVLARITQDKARFIALREHHLQ